MSLVYDDESLSDETIALFHCVVAKNINPDLADFYYSMTENVIALGGYSIINIPKKLIKGKHWKKSIIESANLMLKLQQQASIREKELKEKTGDLQAAYRRFINNPSAMNYVGLEYLMHQYQQERFPE